MRPTTTPVDPRQHEEAVERQLDQLRQAAGFPLPPSHRRPIAPPPIIDDRASRIVQLAVELESERLRLHRVIDSQQRQIEDLQAKNKALADRIIADPEASRRFFVARTGIDG